MSPESWLIKQRRPVHRQGRSWWRLKTFELFQSPSRNLDLNLEVGSHPLRRYREVPRIPVFASQQGSPSQSPLSPAKRVEAG